MNGAKSSGRITSSSSCLALRQNGSLSSLKMRSISERLLPEVDVRDLGLALEDRAHQRGQCGIDVDDLLELVDHERRARVAVGGDLRRQLEQPFERGIDILGRVASVEAEADAAGVRVEHDLRRDPKAAEERRDLLPHARAGCRHVVVDRRGELLGELLFRRRREQVDLRDEHVAGGDELLGGAPDERGLAVAARREDDHVLAVSQVCGQLAELGLAVRERFVEGEVAVAEGIGVAPRHPLIVPDGIVPSRTMPVGPVTPTRSSRAAST